MFADDVVFYGKERQDVEGEVEVWRRSLEDYGMNVIREKTEYQRMQAGDRDEGGVELRGAKLKRVREFKYSFVLNYRGVTLQFLKFFTPHSIS